MRSCGFCCLCREMKLGFIEERYYKAATKFNLSKLSLDLTFLRLKNMENPKVFLRIFATF